jgi:hypothetical protein
MMRRMCQMARKLLARPDIELRLNTWRKAEIVKVSISESVHIETEVNVDIDDIASALQERLRSVAERFEENNEHDTAKNRELLGFMNSTYQCLKGVSDAMIASVTPSQRKILYDAFAAQAERWKGSETK